MSSESCLIPSYRLVETLYIERYIPEILAKMANIDVVAEERKQADLQLWYLREEYEKEHEVRASDFMYGSTIWRQRDVNKWILAMPIYMKVEVSI